MGMFKEVLAQPENPQERDYVVSFILNVPTMDVDPRFEKLFEPGRIGKMELKNRIVMAPISIGFAAEDGSINDRTKNFYAERAKGGVGLIVTGIGAIHPRGRLLPGQLGIYNDEFIPGLAELAETVHRHGAKVAVQIGRAGKTSVEDFAIGYQPRSSTCATIPMGEAMRDTTGEEISRLLKRYVKMPIRIETVALTVEEIHDIIRQFAEAAERVRKAGIDGVEIHAGHGYLLNEFLSRSWNKREDEYGGELKNRARIVLEVIKAIRDKVGSDYPAWIRMDGREFGVEDGITIEEAKELACMFEEAGVDAIHVSGYGGVVGGFYDAPIVYQPGNLVPLAEGIKKVVKIPVIAVGRISPELGEQVLRKGQADFIAMARPILADPELPNKLASGKLEDIRWCIYCYNCVSQIFFGEPVTCAVNAAAGKEAEFRIEPVEKPKKVMVVGGGPAGMEAARIAALRGHEVLLYEKGQRLGGSLALASVVQPDNVGFFRYLVTQMGKLPIEVKLGEEVTPALIEEIKPDVVILALGGNLAVPEIPGTDRLPSPLKKSSVRRLTKLWIPQGKSVVIIGGSMVGCELAEFLAKRGRKVTILVSEIDMAVEMSVTKRWNIMRELRQNGVTMLKRVEYEKITPKKVVITDDHGEKRTIEADTVVVAGGVEPNGALLRAIEGKVPQVHLVGDCSEPRLIKGAVEDGARAALAI